MNERERMIVAALAKSVALSGHVGDVHEALDHALVLLGFHKVPTHEDGTMAATDWLQDAPSLWGLK